MRIERLGKTPSGKIHGRAIFAPDEREQAVTIMERLDSIRDEQHHSRPPRARTPWTSSTLDSWDGTTLVTFGDFHELAPLTELFQ